MTKSPYGKVRRVAGKRPATLMLSKPRGLLGALENFAAEPFTPQSAAEYLKLIERIHHSRGEPARDWECVYMYSTGSILDTIAAHIGVTRERVRQIINATHPQVSVPRLRDARRVISAHQHEQLKRQVYEWSVYNPGMPGEVCEREFGVSPATARKLLGGRAKLHYTIKSRESYRTRWSDEELLRLIRQWWSESNDHSSLSFEQWSVPRGGPTRQTPIIRFGKWSHALEQAGFNGAQVSRNNRVKHGEEDLWASVVEYYMTPRSSYSYADFDMYGRSIPGMPSAALVRKRLGLSWRQLTERAKEIIAGTCREDPQWVERVKAPRHWPDHIGSFRGSPQRIHEATEIIREYIAQRGNPVVIARYDRWAKKHNRECAARLLNSTGLKWRDLVAEAGGTCGERRGAFVRTTEEVLGALRVYLNSTTQPTFDGYKKWAREHNALSAAALTSRFGSWNEAKRLASG